MPAPTIGHWRMPIAPKKECSKSRPHTLRWCGQIELTMRATDALSGECHLAINSQQQLGAAAQISVSSWAEEENGKARMVKKITAI